MTSCVRIVSGTAMVLAIGISLALTTSTAGADIIAVLEHQSSTDSHFDPDIVRVNAGAGGMTAASFNTSALEVHPSVSSDGRRIAFARYNEVPTAATEPTAILMNDVQTGRTAEVFTNAELNGTFGGTTIGSISPDGPTLVTGAYFKSISPPLYSPAVGMSNLTGFPSGPYPYSTYETQYTFSEFGELEEPVESPPLIAFRLSETHGAAPSLVVGQLQGAASLPLISKTVTYSHPVIGSPDGVPTIAFEQQQNQSGVRDLAYRPAAQASFVGPPIPFRGLNTSAAFNPAFSPDGRYLGFLREDPNGHTRLFVWDSETQTMLNPAGVDVGVAYAQGLGNQGSMFEDAENLSLYETPVLNRGIVTSVGNVNFNVEQDTAVGILVQRIVGHHQQFGRTVPTLAPVGHVPLGTFRHGSHDLRWNLRVDGHRLKAGTYQVTLRALSQNKQIRDFGVPHLIRAR